MAILVTDLILYVKLFQCGLCRNLFAVMNEKPITGIPQCPTCEAVTVGTREVQFDEFAR